jgi:hypothetical protein
LHLAKMLSFIPLLASTHPHKNFSSFSFPERWSSRFYLKPVVEIQCFSRCSLHCMVKAGTRLFSFYWCQILSWKQVCMEE